MINDLNDDEIYPHQYPATELDITPRDRLRFAKTILFVLAIMFSFGAITEILYPQNNVFEACRTILPSFATLVIGYYFGKM